MGELSYIIKVRSDYDYINYTEKSLLSPFSKTLMVVMTMKTRKRKMMRMAMIHVSLMLLILNLRIWLRMEMKKKLPMVLPEKGVCYNQEQCK